MAQATKHKSDGINPVLQSQKPKTWVLVETQKGLMFSKNIFKNRKVRMKALIAAY